MNPVQLCVDDNQVFRILFIGSFRNQIEEIIKKHL